MTRLLRSAITLLVGVVFASCATVLPTQVTYDRTERWVVGVPGKIQCNGAIAFTRFRGLMHLTVEGPSFDSDSYAISFKRGPDHPDDFYFSYGPDDHSGATITEAKGTVRFLPDDFVEVNLKIKGPGGDWISPPINGRHRITLVLPEGRRH